MSHKNSTKAEYLENDAKGCQEYYEKCKKHLKRAQESGFYPLLTAKLIVQRNGFTKKTLIAKMESLIDGNNLNFIPLKEFDRHYMSFGIKKGDKFGASLAESLSVLKHAIKYHVLGLTREQVSKMEVKQANHTWETVITKY